MIQLRNLVLALSALLPLQCQPSAWPTLHALVLNRFEPRRGLGTHLFAHDGTHMLLVRWRSDTRMNSGLLIACQLGGRYAVIRCSGSSCVILFSGVPSTPERSASA